jgi:anti-sigma regulatory factor (Ser/Thr protein kinase)
MSEMSQAPVQGDQRPGDAGDRRLWASIRLVLADASSLDPVHFRLDADTRWLANYLIDRAAQGAEALAYTLRTIIGRVANPARGSAQAVGMSVVLTCEAFARCWRHVSSATPARVAEFNRDVELLRMMLDGLATPTEPEGRFGAAADHAPGVGLRHAARFYDGPQDYLDGTIPFVEDGLAAAEPVLVAVPGPNLELLREALGSIPAGVQWQDMTEVGRNPGRIIPAVLLAFADAHPTTRVRIIGEPVWPGRSEVEYPACARHEALVNYALKDRAADILCPYDTVGLDNGALADAGANHPVLADSGGWRGSDDYAPDRILVDYNLPLSEPHLTADWVVDDADGIASARQFASTHARQVGLAADRLLDFEVIVSELVTHSLVYGGGIARVWIWADESYLICQVRDRGPLTDRLAGCRIPDPSSVGGWALLVVHQLSELVSVHASDTGTTIRACLARAPAG